MPPMTGRMKHILTGLALYAPVPLLAILYQFWPYGAFILLAIIHYILLNKHVLRMTEHAELVKKAPDALARMFDRIDHLEKMGVSPDGFTVEITKDFERRQKLYRITARRIEPATAEKPERN